MQATLCTKKTIAINLPNMSNLVADRRDVADSRVETLLRVRRAIQTLTDFGPNVVRKQQGRELTKVKIVDDGQWLRSGRARSERSGKRLAFTLRQSRFNPLGRFSPKCAA